MYGGGGVRLPPLYFVPTKKREGQGFDSLPLSIVSGFKSPHESFKGARVAVMLGKVSERGGVGARAEVVRVFAKLPGGLLSRVSLNALLLRLIRFAAAHVMLLSLMDERGAG
jgi:hypothetical protein